MISTVAPVVALLSSVALLLMGNGLQGTLLPVRAGIEAFSTFDIGILGSAYFVGFVAGCFVGPHIVRRAGHIRAFTALVAIASTVALVHALFVDPYVWWPLRAVTGFCFAGLYVVIESWLNERSTNQTRGTILSIYTMVNLTVITLGQLMITLYDPAAFPLFALASILVSLAAVPVALTTSPPPAPLARVRLRPLRLYRLSPVGFLGCLAVGFANGPFWTLAPLFALESGLDLTGVALFMSVPVLAGAVAQWPFGRLSDSIDRRLVIAVVFLLGTGAGIAVAIAGHVWPQGLLYAAGAFGAAAFPVYAVCVAHANDFAAADEFVETSSGLLLANGIGSAVGPLLASAAMHQVGPAGLFGFTAAVHLIMAAFTLYRMRRRTAVPAAEKPHFVAVPRTAPTVFELDERGPEHHAAGETAAAPPR